MCVEHKVQRHSRKASQPHRNTGLAQKDFATVGNTVLISAPNFTTPNALCWQTRISMLRALCLVVCLAHTATGWSIVPTTGQPLVARPRLVRAVPSVMVTPTTEMLAVAAAAPIPSALAAYGHYLSFMVCTACLTAERLTIKPAMNMAEEKVMAVADSAYGLASLLLVYTGYLRVTQYGKGWAFYQHEPIFWVKLTLLAVAGAASFFPTTIIIQRSVSSAILT